MSWLSDFVTIAGPAGLISGGLTHALSGWREKSTGKRQARFLGLQVSIILERFAGDCLNVISEIDVAAQLNHDPSDMPTNLPALAEFPKDDLGWRAMDATLAHRMLSTHVDRGVAQGSVNDEWMCGGSNSASLECARQAAILGWQAWQTASDVRCAYGLPPYIPQYAFYESLQKLVVDDENARLADSGAVSKTFPDKDQT